MDERDIFTSSFKEEGTKLLPALGSRGEKGLPHPHTRLLQGIFTGATGVPGVMPGRHRTQNIPLQSGGWPCQKEGLGSLPSSSPPPEAAVGATGNTSCPAHGGRNPAPPDEHSECLQYSSIIMPRRAQDARGTPWQVSPGRAPASHLPLCLLQQAPESLVPQHPVGEVRLAPELRVF